MPWRFKLLLRKSIILYWKILDDDDIFDNSNYLYLKFWVQAGLYYKFSRVIYVPYKFHFVFCVHSHRCDKRKESRSVCVCLSRKSMREIFIICDISGKFVWPSIIFSFACRDAFKNDVVPMEHYFRRYFHVDCRLGSYC